MSVDVNSLFESLTGFYLSFNIVAAVLATVPGALAEKKNCASLERFHFLLFFFGGVLVMGFIYHEMTRAMLADHVWKAQLGMSIVAGLYLGNVASRRLRNAGKKKLLALLIWVPILNVALLAALAMIPTAPKKNVPSDTDISSAQVA